MSPSAMREHRFTRTTLLLWSTLLIWMGNFVLVYVFAAVACARQFADLRVLGMGIVPFAGLLSSAVAVLAIVWLGTRARQQMRSAPMQDPTTSFINAVVLATGVLALIGMLYLVLPLILLARGCAGGA